MPQGKGRGEWEWIPTTVSNKNNATHLPLAKKTYSSQQVEKKSHWTLEVGGWLTHVMQITAMLSKQKLTCGQNGKISTFLLLTVQKLLLTRLRLCAFPWENCIWEVVCQHRKFLPLYTLGSKIIQRENILIFHSTEYQGRLPCLAYNQAKSEMWAGKWILKTKSTTLMPSPLLKHYYHRTLHVMIRPSLPVPTPKRTQVLRLAVSLTNTFFSSAAEHHTELPISIANWEDTLS